MRWIDLYYMLVDREDRQARLVGLAWIAASRSGDAALLSSLSHDSFHGSGVCEALDAAGIPPPSADQVVSKAPTMVTVPAFRALPASPPDEQL